MDIEATKALIVQEAARAGVRPALVYGVCMAESGMDAGACRYEALYRWLYQPESVKPSICSLATETVMQKTSWGLMQCMGALLRAQGLRGWLPLVLADPQVQLWHGCRYLAKCIKEYEDEQSGVAAYNAGRARRTPTGEFINQKYVDRVMKHSREWDGGA
jgi:hypothetical protein